MLGCWHTILLGISLAPNIGIVLLAYGERNYTDEHFPLHRKRCAQPPKGDLFGSSEIHRLSKAWYIYESIDSPQQSLYPSKIALGASHIKRNMTPMHFIIFGSNCSQDILMN